MELNEQEKTLVLSLIRLGWEAGAVKSPELSAAFQALAAKLLAKPEAKGKMELV